MQKPCYGAVPIVETLDVPIVETVEGYPSVVKVVAPIDLPEGYEYEVEALGYRMVATVVRMCRLSAGDNSFASLVAVGLTTH